MARFLHLTDLHVVAKGALASGVLDTRAMLGVSIDRLLEQSSALGPFDAVLVTGDVSDDGSADSYALARAELDRLRLPILVVPGNHDTREALRAGFSDLPIMPTRGLIDWIADVGDTRVIGLDTLVEGQGGGRLRAESISHLAESLAGAGARPVVVALHHPPLLTGIRFMDAIGLENAIALDETLAAAPGPVLVVAGHVHGVHFGRIGGHPVATALSTCSSFALDRMADAPVGFFTAPTGCAVIDTGPGGAWSSVPFETSPGPYPF